MMDGITITGLDDCLKFFDNLPENVVRATRNAMRDGGRATARQIRQRVPKRWTRLVKSKVTNKGNLYATIGMFNGHQAQGNQPKGKAPVDDWFKMYWLNYGTLEGRDPSHQFDRPVKHSSTSAAKRRRGQSGIQHRNFFEEAIRGWRETFMTSFNESFKRQEKTLYDR
jgi:hypothetical protein